MAHSIGDVLNHQSSYVSAVVSPQRKVALRLIDEFEMTHQQVADAIGKSRATVSNLLRLLDLHSEVKQLLGKGLIEMGHARALLSLEDKKQIEIANKVDSFLFIGDGFFHPVGLAVATGKEVIAINPIEKKIYKKEIEEMKEKILRQRYAIISKAMKAKKFGIIISYKIGQRRMQLAKSLKKSIEKKGKKAYLVLLNEINEKINYLGYDCYVSTACPRVAIDDFMRYEKPILTPIELQILLGKREWKDYEFDQIL